VTDQDHDNIELFRTDFVDGQENFSAWLGEHLSSGAVYPFLMGGPQQYDLGDLLRALLPSAKEKEHQLLQIAFQKQFATAAHGFDVEGLRILGHAVARSGFSTVTFDLANSIEVLLLKLALANWTEQEQALAFVAIDQIIAALATFAFDGDANSLRVSRSLFEQSALAPFASTLFGPLALSSLKFWPILWKQLLAQASRQVPLFGHPPNPKWRNEQFGLEAAHFDIFYIFENFLEDAHAKEFTLQQIYDAAQVNDLEGPTNRAARIALYEMEECGKIVRRIGNDHDELYLNPRQIEPKLKTPERQLEKAALVAPNTKHDWSAAPGRSPLEFMIIIKNRTTTNHGLRYG
jgi:hypothetical protein